MNGFMNGRGLLRVLAMVLLLGIPISLYMFSGDSGTLAQAGFPGGRAAKQVRPGGIQVKGNTTANGDIVIDAINKGNVPATDFHITVVAPEGAKISQIVTYAPMNQVMGDQPGAPDPSNPPNVYPPTSSVGVRIGAGQNPLPVGQGQPNDPRQSVDIVVVDAQGNPINNKEVTLKLQWSRGANANVLVDGFGAGAIGDGDPITLLSELDIPDFTGSPVEVVSESDAALLSTFVIAERDGTRFDKGDIVVSLEGMGQFTDLSNLIVEVRDEDGQPVTGAPDRITIEEVRINRNGAIVVTITRDSDDEEPLMLVFRSAYVTDITDIFPGVTVSAKVSGSAVYGRCMNEFVDLFTIVPSE